MISQDKTMKTLSYTSCDFKILNCIFWSEIDKSNYKYLVKLTLNMYYAFYLDTVFKLGASTNDQESLFCSGSMCWVLNTLIYLKAPLFGLIKTKQKEKKTHTILIKM